MNAISENTIRLKTNEVALTDHPYCLNWEYVNKTGVMVRLPESINGVDAVRCTMDAKYKSLEVITAKLEVLWYSGFPGYENELKNATDNFAKILKAYTL